VAFDPSAQKGRRYHSTISIQAKVGERAPAAVTHGGICGEEIARVAPSYPPILIIRVRADVIGRNFLVKITRHLGNLPWLELERRGGQDALGHFVGRRTR